MYLKEKYFKTLAKDGAWLSLKSFLWILLKIKTRQRVR